MNPSIQHLIKAIVDSLESEVLPHLDPQAKPASNVRACVMLLANIEARVTHEARSLFDDNRELHLLLQAASDDAAKLGLSPDVRNALATALKKYPLQEVYFDAGAAADENRALQELLTQVINQPSTAATDRAMFRNKLHGYLQETGKRELQLVEKALGRVPV